MSALEPHERRAVQNALDQYGDQPGPLLVVLHAIQDAIGYIPEAGIAAVAAHLNLSRAEVHGTMSFYHHFRHHPSARVVVQVCRAEACQARGGQALEEHVKQRLDCDFHHTSADGKVSLEAIYCMGNCATGPSIRLNGKLYSHVTPERFNSLLAQKVGS
jgi:formate dehydrogenase subunit gamma